VVNTKQKTLLLMEERYGWKKFDKNEAIFWFKGYLVNQSVESLFSEILDQASINTSSVSDIANKLRGNFAFIVSIEDIIIAVVDKVATVPIFYVDSGNSVYIGNNASLLKNSAKFSLNDMNYQSLLEVSMSGYTLGRKTLFNTMYQVSAGECLICQDGKIKSKYYHTYSPWTCVNNRSRKMIKSDLTNVLYSIIEALADSAKGRQIVVPLSAGYDSRLIVSGLKEIGFKDVVCISYGRKNSFEVKAADAIAKILGYKFKHVCFDSKYVKRYYSSIEYSKFKKDFNRYDSVDFIQDLTAISYLHHHGEIDDDAIIVNGMTGDFISGGHIQKIFNPSSFTLDCNHLDDSKIFKNALLSHIRKHYHLWSGLMTASNIEYLTNSIQAELNERLNSMVNREYLYAVFEFLEFYGRQSKFVVKGQEVYDYYGYDWRLPLWDPVFIDFWESVPLEYKYSQSLYKEVLVENDWGGVWNIPLNKERINPQLVRFLRLPFKIILSPLGKKSWHRFEKNVFSYWMSDDYSTKRYPYKKYLTDLHGHRNEISFRALDYVASYMQLKRTSASIFSNYKKVLSERMSDY
jgi:asparagine synthase (glutamine-hydrolysing)